MFRALGLTISVFGLLLAKASYAQTTFKEYFRELEYEKDLSPSQLEEFRRGKGQVQISRSEYPLPFKVRILHYIDYQNGNKIAGPWTFKFEKLDPKKAKSEFPTIDGERIKARSITYEVITDYGKKTLTTERNTGLSAQVIILISEESLPPLLVPRSASNRSHDLLHAILTSESLRDDDTQRMEYIRSLPTMSYHEVRDLIASLREADSAIGRARGGNSSPAKKRSYRIVDDDDKRLTATE